MDSDSDEDSETQIKDLEQLNAVLEADEPCSSAASTSSLNVLTSLDKYDEYTRIETAIALNKLTDSKLMRLEKILCDRLNECRVKLAEFQNLDRLPDKVDKAESFRYIHCSKPYFKDKDGFHPPDNADTILMKKSGMFDLSSIASVPGWTVKDKSSFLALILKMSKQIRIDNLNSQIAQIRRDTKISESKKEKEYAALKMEISQVSKKTLKELALPIDFEYDWETISNKLNCRHSAQEYCSLWRLFLHPSITKDCWSKSEHLNLQKIAYANKMQNWEIIAQELNTNRTEYQCFVYFRTNMSSTFSNQKWTKEEEEYLKRIIEFYREDDYIPWGRVAASMENRTKIQIYNKYLRLVEDRKGRFLPEEDAVMLTCAEKYGTNFRIIKSFLPGRSALQLRSRFKVLMKTRISTVWTVAEDKKLIQLMANQDSVTNYSSISKFLPGKDRLHIRSRYLTLVKWMQRNPNVDILHAPRRGARRLGHGLSSGDLNEALEKLKTRMQSEVNYKKSKQITEESSENDIEDAIIAYFFTEGMRNIKSKDTNDEDLVLSDNSVIPAGSLNTTNLQKILIMLKAKLQKTAFQQSNYFDDYPELCNPKKEVSLVKLKSYSKKNITQPITIDNCPDIWGNNILEPAEYVLPPHFATITGCRALINHISTKKIAKVDMNPLRCTNIVFRKHLYTLIERFNVLFLWPMLLSNEIPSNNKSLKETFNVLPEGNWSVLNRRNAKSFRNSLLYENDENSDDD